jgi:hypothetical protein
MAWGNRHIRRGRTDQQRWAENAGAIPLPFVVFTEGRISFDDFKWIEKPTAETVNEKSRDYSDGKSVWKFRSVHFSGAAVFSIGEKFFLYDIDRQEIEHGIMNPFLVELPRPVVSVKEAYSALLPGEVVFAVAGGKNVYRQGEYFFVFASQECPVQSTLTLEERRVLKYIPSRTGFFFGNFATYAFVRDDSRQLSTKEIDDFIAKGCRRIDIDEFNIAAIEYERVRKKALEASVVSGNLTGDGSGSHEAERMVKKDGIVYVSGLIKHARREHTELLLDGWYSVHKNLAVRSLTITGQVD